MAETAIEPKTTRTADSFEEHKKIRKPEPIVEKTIEPSRTEPQAQEPSKAISEEVPVSETGKETPSESAGVSETPKSTQDQEKKPKRHDLDDRFRVLTDRFEAKLEDERKRHQAEIADLRKQLVPPQPAAAAEQPKPAVADDKPAFEKFATVDEYMEALVDWKQKRNEAAAAQKRNQEDTITKIADAKTRHADFEQVLTGRYNPQDQSYTLASGLTIPGPVMHLLMNVDNGRDVLYQVASEPLVLGQILKLSIPQQVVELGHMAKTYQNPEASPAPEKPRLQPVPVSRITAPMRGVSGNELPAVETTDKANSLEEHKRIRLRELKRQGRIA